NADILGISPHRVYLVSLQHYLYILSVALVLVFRLTDVIRYATLWCPDFPLHYELDPESYEIKLKTQDDETSSA
ncbi:MAG: hypothetical protein ACOYLT_00475, partial [Flavobacterium sp.]|uniref:hypothetical protein n=1 Tax=Flavobacterium sp. TaxID=239 RepID=UPI003BE3E649